LEKFEVKKIFKGLKYNLIYKDFLSVIKEYLQEEEKMLKEAKDEEQKRSAKIKDKDEKKKSQELINQHHGNMVQVNKKKKEVNELDGYVETFVGIIFKNTSKISFDYFRDVVENIVGLEKAKKIVEFEN
jgi:hypothetical protein